MKYKYTRNIEDQHKLIFCFYLLECEIGVEVLFAIYLKFYINKDSIKKGL
jgi:hypothetical protein